MSTHVKSGASGFVSLLLDQMDIEKMRHARLQSISVVVTLAILLQSAVFANVCPNPGVKKDCSLEHGQSLPVLDIRVGGEISVSDNKMVKKPWSSKSLESKGKVQLVQYVAANRGAARQNRPFTDAMLEKKFPSEKLETTVIVNMADTMTFAKGYVADRLVKNKLKHQAVNFVIDDNGVGLQRWGMKHESFAIIVLDASGKVLFAKDGPLSELEIEDTIRLIESQII